MRRRVLHLILLVGAALAAGLLLRREQAPALLPSNGEHEWVLVYYMSYDNNLEHCGPVILDQLTRGAKRSDLLVTVLSDDRDPGGLRRHTITSAGRTEERLTTDNSASEEVLSDYLDWVAAAHPARHYAVVFLNHGGRLDEMCLDEYTGDSGKQRWLSARLVGPILRGFRNDVSGEVELLFLQQCGRGSLENLYSFRGAAKAIMASQMSVGAPNTYYEPVLRWLASRRQTAGAPLASQIMSHDRHFTSYVCVDGDALQELPRRLDPVVRGLLGDDERTLEPVAGMRPCFRYKTETYYDLLGWLESAYRENKRPTEPLTAFSEWVRDKLIVTVKSHSYRGRDGEGLCGLSLFVPESKHVRGAYLGYPIYRASTLEDSWNRMFPEAAK